MRIIYDARRETNLGFLLAGLVWGSMLAVSAIAFLEHVVFSSPEQRVMPLATVEVWVTGWLAAGLAGGICLLVGLLLWAVAPRIAADEHGIKQLRSWGGDRFLFLWGDVRSWRTESFEEVSYDTDGQGGKATLCRLVVKLKSTEEPLVVKDDWHVAVASELRAVVPIRPTQDAKLGAATNEKAPDLEIP